jgi:hypothetical protein
MVHHHYLYQDDHKRRKTKTNTPKYNINLVTPGEYPQLIAKKVAMISFMAYKNPHPLLV